ncbi:hypothetical protein GX441_01905 [bacterium]|nr:hypothetical protein [bacterium]
MEDVVTHEKGVELFEIKAWLDKRYTPSDMEKISAKLSPEARNILLAPVGNEWYPIELVREIYNTIHEVLKDKDPRALVDYGRFSAEESTSGLLKFLMKFIDMDAVIKRMKAFWKHYHKGGKITSSELLEEKGRKKRIISFHGYDAGEPACLAPEGYLAVIGQRAGGKNVKVVKRECIHKGDDMCSWEVSWE